MANDIGVEFSHAQGKNKKIELEYVWTINKNKLNSKVTKSNLPDLIRIGTTRSDTIISINESELTLEDSDGIDATLKRIK